MKYDGKFYDPSYGTGPFDSLTEWEDGSVEGFGVQFIPSNGQAAQFKYWLRSIDVKGTQETTP